jgi:ferredoxin
MLGSVSLSSLLNDRLLDRLSDAVVGDRVVWGPQCGADGAWRLRRIDDAGALPLLAQLTRLPIKKLLLPSGEAICSYRDGGYADDERSTPLLIVGVPLCELQSLWYLDQLFAQETRYRQRRSRLFVVGAACEPGPECRCDRQLMPLAGDLLLDRQQVWALSSAGLAVLASIGAATLEERPLPWPTAPAERRRALTAEQLQAQQRAEAWVTEGKRCLSCGACSAVCPTCYCFDLMDVVGADASVRRERVWDNCFFAEHGQVAGGFDFRPSRAERLRFRMEHKRLGFGALRGQDSCVGCGRCRVACPVAIDLDEIAAKLAGGRDE